MLSEKALFKDDRSPYWQYRFQVGGRKFQGSTGCAGKKKAREYALDLYEQARKDLKELPHSTLRGLTIEQAVARYIVDVVSKWSNAANRAYFADTCLGDIVRFFGPSRMLASIDEQAVRALARWRKSQRCGGRDMQRHRIDATRMIEAPQVSDATVNRTAILPLKYILAAARRWPVPDLPDIPWAKVLYKERAKPRNFLAPNALSLEALHSPDYMRFIDFARISGLRLEECFLEKWQVGATHIRTVIKGGEEVLHPISDAMRRILDVAMDNPTDAVFTYTLTQNGRWGRKGDVRPLTYSGVEAAWKRARRKGAIPAELRIHDLRHSFAMELLRETHNPVIVQKALHHKRIETTMRYARALDEDVLAGLNRLQGRPETAGISAGLEPEISENVIKLRA